MTPRDRRNRVKTILRGVTPASLDSRIAAVVGRVVEAERTFVPVQEYAEFLSGQLATLESHLQETDLLIDRPALTAAVHDLQSIRRDLAERLPLLEALIGSSLASMALKATRIKLHARDEIAEIVADAKAAIARVTPPQSAIGRLKWLCGR